MNVIFGAAGQVGSQIVAELIKRSQPVRAIVRSKKKEFDKKVEVRTADLLNTSQVNEALQGATAVFLLTPENPASNDIIGETRQIIENYREAIRTHHIKKIIGLSSVGAHVEGKTGNLLMSRMLEHAFDEINVSKIFIRPSYYYSNWLGFMESVQQHGVLPTFFPEHLKMEMNSPLDLARFVAEALLSEDRSSEQRIVELTGPAAYSSADVADVFSKVFGKKVRVQPMPKKEWSAMLTSAGFTPNTSYHLIDMTQAVIDQLTIPENQDKAVQLPTTLEQYLLEKINKV
jgi:uncharacterized protein YbjT (DUF2867 family)